MIFGRLAGSPVPVATGLNVHDADVMVAEKFLAALASQIVSQAEGFLENLRTHNSTADRQINPASKPLGAAGDDSGVDPCSPADRRAAEHRVVDVNIIAYARMDGHGNPSFVATSWDGIFFVRVGYANLSASQAKRFHRR